MNLSNNPSEWTREERLHAAIAQVRLEAQHWLENGISLEHLRARMNEALHVINGTTSTLVVK